MVCSNASWVMVTWDPSPNRLTDMNETLPSYSFVGGGNNVFEYYSASDYGDRCTKG